MLPSTARNITCDTGIKRTVTLGENVDARTLLAHAPIGRPLFKRGVGSGSPLSRGRRGFVIRPSEDTREMRRIYANLRTPGTRPVGRRVRKYRWMRSLIPTPLSRVTQQSDVAVHRRCAKTNAS